MGRVHDAAGGGFPQETVDAIWDLVWKGLLTNDTLHALRDVNVDVARGEFFGIVGRNGSGKSTLLKCLAGIYAADRGDIHLDGRLSAFIELGVGFSMDLPARDNVIINATMLGLSPREARRRVEGVVDFA